MHGNDLLGLLIGVTMVFVLAGYLAYVLTRPERF
jgi:K+-transporting ATPase KdpF subunit